VRVGPGASGWGTREALIDAVGWSLVPLYYLMEPLTIFILLGLLVWSMVKVIVSVIDRVCTGLGAWASDCSMHFGACIPADH
jgi:hypothetical protein